MLAFNVEETLVHTLNRINPVFGKSILKLLISDDNSSDKTFAVARGYSNAALGFPIDVIKQNTNLGYGSNQKFCYKYAKDIGAEIVVMLHGDGQYAPEFLASMTDPITNGVADVVLGSRMLTKGNALQGGMPMYKFIGNTILTFLQNKLTKTSLSEWHSGFRAYRISALSAVDLSSNSDGFDFDTQIILQMLKSKQRIFENFFKIVPQRESHHLKLSLILKKLDSTNFRQTQVFPWLFLIPKQESRSARIQNRAYLKQANISRHSLVKNELSGLKSSLELPQKCPYL